MDEIGTGQGNKYMIMRESIIAGEGGQEMRGVKRMIVKEEIVQAREREIELDVRRGKSYIMGRDKG